MFYIVWILCGWAVALYMSWVAREIEESPLKIEFSLIDFIVTSGIIILWPPVLVVTTMAHMKGRQ